VVQEAGSLWSVRWLAALDRQDLGSPPLGLEGERVDVRGSNRGAIDVRER
jgi:hypothetical protein